MTMNSIKSHLSTLDSLLTEVEADKGKYIQPALRNLGAVSIVLVREIVAPTVFKNSDAENTDIDVQTSKGLIQAVRAVPNKFKHRERGRGLQILRDLNVGGAYPQNKASVGKKAPLKDVFDLNSFVFGDSVLRDGSVLPCKAATMYSDGISTADYVASVGKTFHNRAYEDGSLFDALAKKNSSNIFDRHFILPGTLFVQTISTVGKVMTPEALDHLLLSIGFGGSYGGQTSISGVNVRTHVAGIYGGKVERPETSPYLLASELLVQDRRQTAEEVIDHVASKLAPLHASSVDAAEARAYIEDLSARLEGNDEALVKQYRAAADKVGELYEQWFEGKAQ